MTVDATTTDTTIDQAAIDQSTKESAAEGTEAGVYADDTPVEDGEESTKEVKVEKVEKDEGTETEAEKEAKKAAEAADDTVPEKYEFSLPDGMKLDEEGAAKFTEIAKELGLTQATVGKFTEFYIDRLQQADKSGADALMTRFNAEVTTWREESDTIAPEGSPERAAAGKAIERFGSAETRKWLKESRIGDHPEMLRFCIRAGQAISEDKLVTVDGSGDQKVDESPEYDRGPY